jgi:polyhydroxybutyrate depolymerase
MWIPSLLLLLVGTSSMLTVVACSDERAPERTDDESASQSDDTDDEDDVAIDSGARRDASLPTRSDAGRPGSMQTDAGTASSRNMDASGEPQPDRSGERVDGATGRDEPRDGSAADAGRAEPVACPATTLAPGETTTTLQVGGAARSFILQVPQGYTGKTPVPLVIDWHSLLSTGAAQKRGSGYEALSEKEGFIVAWPNGIDNAWNVGPCCTDSRTLDDVAFARAIVDDLKKRACIDSKRVYAGGYSMGGGMSHHLACNAADVFAAVAPSAFDLLTEDEQPCKPARPISVVMFRGTLDPVVPYAGGASRPPNGLDVTIHFRGAEATFKRWSELNGCTGAPSDSGDGCKTYSACAEGTEVTLCTKQGGGHDTGDATRGWATMQKHPMP